MANGVIRWRDIQNLLVTEGQINLLAGLTAIAADINRISGYSYSGSQLNEAYESVALMDAHIGKHLTAAHEVLTNSLDGGALANGTVALEKLSFLPMLSSDDLRLTSGLSSMEDLVEDLTGQVNALYAIVLPGQANDIAASINEMVAHIEKTHDAHDASAISFGNQYIATMDTPAGSSQSKLSLSNIRFVRTGDIVSLQSTSFGPENCTVNFVNYNTGHIGFATPVVGDYQMSDSFTVHVNTQDNLDEAIQRSLRNTTDILDGRLTINQSTADSALVINHTGSNYTAQFNNFTSKTEANFEIELGKIDGTSLFAIRNDNARLAMFVYDDGEVVANNYSLWDHGSLFGGKITKQPLTANRTWTLPDRSGYMGVGDLTFTELLKVKVDKLAKTASIAPGFLTDYEGQKMSAWISMDYPCQYPGGSFNIQTRLQAENQLLTLGNKWQVFVIYVDDSSQIGFQYGPQRTIRQEALDEYENFIPSAFMKLAKIIVQGDNVGGILSSSIEILEDQRPFLSMGLSSAYYDETIVSVPGLSAGSIVNIPVNSRAGGSLMTYQPGRSQLEVYIDGTYQRVNIDYEEYQGTPFGRVRLLKDLPSNSNIRFRITFRSAAIAGGIDVESLQTVYQAGPSILLSQIIGPITMQSYDLDVLLSITGDMLLQGVLQGLRATEFVQQTSVPGDITKNKLFVDNFNKLIFHQYTAGQPKDWDILSEIEKAQSSMVITVNNMTGVDIPKARGVALHPSLNNHVVLCDTSNALSTSRLLGVTTDIIPSGSTGQIVLGGSFIDSGLVITHKNVVVVDPRNPGRLVDVASVTFLPNDQYQEVGQMNGGNLIVAIDRNKKNLKSWKSGIAGEAFAANITKVVRYGFNSETKGSVYNATKELANTNQKFWAIAAVQPKASILATDPLDLFVDVDLAAGDASFDDEDVGLPLYLDTNGDFKPWRLIKGTYALGDAIVKIGIIENLRKFIIKDVQMMGTAPGPMV